MGIAGKLLGSQDLKCDQLGGPQLAPLSLLFAADMAITRKGCWRSWQGSFFLFFFYFWVNKCWDIPGSGVRPLLVKSFYHKESLSQRNEGPKIAMGKIKWDNKSKSFHLPTSEIAELSFNCPFKTFFQTTSYFFFLISPSRWDFKPRGKDQECHLANLEGSSWGFPGSETGEVLFQWPLIKNSALTWKEAS